MTDSPEVHVRRLLESLGLDSDTERELEQTPERFVEMLNTAFSGLDSEPPSLSTFESDDVGPSESEPIVLTDLSFYSMCVHHLVPFFGTVDVAYVPAEHVTGFSSVGRVIDHFASRPQLQETLTRQIADRLWDALEPQGVLVRCRARQMCMEMRGPEKRGHLVATASRGSLQEGERRRELLNTFAREQGAP